MGGDVQVGGGVNGVGDGPGVREGVGLWYRVGVAVRGASLVCANAAVADFAQGGMNGSAVGCAVDEGAAVKVGRGV